MGLEHLKEIQKMHHQILRVDKLGGRDSFFGLKEIFEIILEEEHDKDNETGMYCFKGMEQYGNTVSLPRVNDTMTRCIEELKFTKQEFESLINWYNNRKYGPDTLILALEMQWYLKDNNIV